MRPCNPRIVTQCAQSVALSTHPRKLSTGDHEEQLRQEDVSAILAIHRSNHSI